MLNMLLQATDLRWCCIYKVYKRQFESVCKTSLLTSPHILASSERRFHHLGCKGVQGVISSENDSRSWIVMICFLVLSCEGEGVVGGCPLPLPPPSPRLPSPVHRLYPSVIKKPKPSCCCHPHPRPCVQIRMDTAAEASEPLTTFDRIQ